MIASSNRLFSVQSTHRAGPPMPVHSGSRVGSDRWGASDGPYGQPPEPLPPPEEPALEEPPLAEPVEDPAEPAEAPPVDEPDVPPAPAVPAVDELPVPEPQSFCAQAASVGLRLRHAARLFFSDELFLPEEEDVLFAIDEEPFVPDVPAAAVLSLLRAVLLTASPCSRPDVLLSLATELTVAPWVVPELPLPEADLELSFAAPVPLP